MKKKIGIGVGIILAVLVAAGAIFCLVQIHLSPVIVYNEDSKEIAKELKEEMGFFVSAVPDTSSRVGSTTILVGNVDREEAASYSQGLREGDEWIRFEGSTIVIQGGTTENLQEVVTYFEDTYMTDWLYGDDFPTDYEDNYYVYGDYTLQALRFDDTEIFQYSIVTKDGEATENALLIQNHIQTVSGYTLPIIAPSELKEGQKAIIFGSSGAREVSDKAAALSASEYLMEEDEGSLYLAAYDESKEDVVTYMFLGETVGCNLYDDTVEAQVVSKEDYSFKFTTEFDGTGKFTAMCTQIANYPVYGDYNVLQGGCTDGTYFYIVMQDQVQSSGNCVIEKIDPATMEVITVSDPLPIDHGNSITYVPSLKRFLVSNCMPDATLVSWIDAETLTYIKTEQLSYSISSIAWSEGRGEYVAAGASKVMLLVNESLKVTQSFNGLASNYTNQGYVCDDDYVYVVSISSNVIHVCDWEGHWIESISMPVATAYEMESMFYYGNMYYTTYIDSGASIYATIFYRRLYD